MAECYHYDDEELADTMRFVRKIRKDETGMMLGALNESIREASANTPSVGMADDVLRLFEAIDRHEITDPFDAASHMFASLTNTDFNSLFEIHFANFDEKIGSKHCE